MILFRDHKDQVVVAEQNYELRIVFVLGLPAALDGVDLLHEFVEHFFPEPEQRDEARLGAGMVAKPWKCHLATASPCRGRRSLFRLEQLLVEGLEILHGT